MLRQVYEFFAYTRWRDVGGYKVRKERKWSFRLWRFKRRLLRFYWRVTNTPE